VAVAKNISNISEPERAKTKAYLVTIVESKAIDLYRRKKKHPSVQLNEEIEGVRIEYEGDNDLAKCLAKLPARYRQFLLLKYAQGFDNRELAEQLDLSMDAIYKLDQRARAKLKALCEEEGVL
jgi:RNA polymerase sigma-70 factor (ECF subfamily)